MKLFRVRVEKVLYVLAEDETEAQYDAQSYASDEDASDVDVEEVETLEKVEPDWLDALPYGTKDDVTIRKWFEKPEEPKPYVDSPGQMRFDFGT